MMLVVFEGLDGVGKSTIVQGVVNAMGGVLMRTPSPLLEKVRQRCSDLPPEIGEALFDFGNMMASAEMEKMQDQMVVCDRYVISTVARRVASEEADHSEMLEDLCSWLWPDHLHQPTLNVHLFLQEGERKQRVRQRGNLTHDEERLEVDSRYRSALLTAYSELCDITIDLTGLDEKQAVTWVMAHLEWHLPVFRQLAW